MNDELERIWKDAVWYNSKIPSRHSHGGTEKNYEKTQSG
jgi:hypothetical protein